MQLNPFAFHLPKTLLDAKQLYFSLDSRKLLAGGTILINNLKKLKVALDEYN